MKLPARIRPKEDLGRRIYSGTAARRAQEGRGFRHTHFMVQRGDTSVSVDRLITAALDVVAALARDASAVRDGPFYGWASVKYQEASRNGRRAVASPQDGNQYHGDIVLPDSAAGNREEQKRHAQELADASTWRQSPTEN